MLLLSKHYDGCMVPLGYMAKRIPEQQPDWLAAPQVTDVYSVSNCVNDDLLDGMMGDDFNGFWFFDSQEQLRATAQAHSIDLENAKLFYYEGYELAWDGEEWVPHQPHPSAKNSVVLPDSMRREGFDVVTACDGPASHSPLSCNSMAREIPTNCHCLIETFEEARLALEKHSFDDCEPGPYEIYAVYSVDWV